MAFDIPTVKCGPLHGLSPLAGLQKGADYMRAPVQVGANSGEALGISDC